MCSSDLILPVATDDIIGDSCRLGSDAHQWHSFLAVLDSPIEPEDVTVIEEGTEPVLLTLEQALTRELTFPVRYVIERHADSLTRKGETPSPRAGEDVNLQNDALGESAGYRRCHG